MKVLAAMMVVAAILTCTIAVSAAFVLAKLWPLLVLAGFGWALSKLARALFGTLRRPSVDDDPLVQAWSQQMASPPEPVEEGRPHLRLVREGPS